MNDRIRGMMKEIEARGGVISINEALPDDITEMFLQEILVCPDCCRAATTDTRDARSNLDEILAGTAMPLKLRGH